MAAPRGRQVTRGDRTWMRGGEAFRYYGAGTKKMVAVDGLTEARAALEALPEAFAEQVAKTIAEAAGMTLSEAQARVPARTGELKESLGMNIRSDGLQAAVGAGAPHAPFVEFGTQRMPSQPFLMPAFRKAAKYVRSAMKGWAAAAGQAVKVGTKRSKNARAVSKQSKAGQKYTARPQKKLNRAERVTGR